MKREDQQDATIRCLLLICVSTCFGQHYAHLQENKCPVTAFGVLFWFCWMWLAAVVGRCFVGCEQCSHPTTWEITWEIIRAVVHLNEALIFMVLSFLQLVPVKTVHFSHYPLQYLHPVTSC
jgi:hypothetical protein